MKCKCAVPVLPAVQKTETRLAAAAQILRQAAVYKSEVFHSTSGGNFPVFACAAGASEAVSAENCQ